MEIKFTTPTENHIQFESIDEACSVRVNFNVCELSTTTEFIGSAFPFMSAINRCFDVMRVKGKCQEKQKLGRMELSDLGYLKCHSK